MPHRLIRLLLLFYEQNGKLTNTTAPPASLPKISSIYYFAPGAHTKGDGWLYQNRALSDVFTFPNGKDGNIDSVYAKSKEL